MTRLLDSRLLDDSPIAVTESRLLFRDDGDSVRQRNCASLIRLGSGRILLAFRLGTGPSRRNDGAIMLSFTDDDGASWSEPHPLYGYPGWDGVLMGGFASLPNGDVRLLLGRLRIDLDLGGPEPADGWYVAATTSRDGGETWSELGPEIRLFPCWTELYGASNPHPVAGDRLLWACQGTLERDAGWQAGVVFTGPGGDDFGAPVVIAAAPDRDYADLDVIRLEDGRFLAVIREMAAKDSVFALSADEGRTWTAPRPTGFKGANIKLVRLRSGAVLCLYRDENPSCPGVGCSVSDDGEHWRSIGQLYAAGSDRADEPGAPCGYPDVVALADGSLLGVLHTYPDADGRVDLFQFRLIDRT